MISIWERHLMNKQTEIKFNELKRDLHREIRRSGTGPGGRALWAVVPTPAFLRFPALLSDLIRAGGADPSSLSLAE